MVLAASSVFAASGSFSSLDLEKASFSDIRKAYEKDMDSFESSSSALRKKLDKAYAQNNGRAYYQTLDQLNELEAPSISRDESELLVERMMSAASDDEKSQWGQWLYENDPYYRPTLTMTLENKGERSRYSFKQTITVRPGEQVKLPTIDYASDRGVFVGWGITPDAVTYEAGTSIEMPYSDQTLYAIFQKGVKFSDSITGIDQFVTDSTAKVPETKAPDASYLFDGWYDQAGNKLEGDTVTVSEDSSATYTAFWKSVAFSDVKTRYYKDMTIPSGQQVPLAFTIRNQGNEALSGIQVSLDMDGVTNLTGDLSSRYIAPGATRNGTFVVVASGSSGDVKKGTITLTDEDGDTWSIPVSITIK